MNQSDVLSVLYQVNTQVAPIKIPVANVDIQPRTLITADMISYTEVLPSTLKGKYILNANLIINKYSNYNTIIPAGSMFYSDAVINERDLPDSAFGAIPEGYTVVSFPVTMASTYGNSMYPGNYINLYFKAINEDTKKLVFGKLISNIEEGLVFSSEGDTIWVCRNCGHIVIGKKAPEICPVCSHAKSFFERKANN